VDLLHYAGVLLADEIRRAVRLALDEDLGSGDVTTQALVPEAATASAVVVAREPLVLAGSEVAEMTFLELSPAVKVERLMLDGQKAVAGAELLRVHGSARGILSAERVALNFLQRLSGVATLTREFVEAVYGTQAKILDTRKTTPGLRRLEKYAVRCGGGENHRLGLFDMVLIKDNHLAALEQESPHPIAIAVQRARQAYPGLRVEVEADNLDQARQAASAGADMILLDNMTIDQLRQAVKIINGRSQTEASGGVNLKTVRAIADTGVNFISIGALTHSARAVDIALDWKLQ
jgi:nicotinate-nucleotide pyrophosphorylase (carboxylating)